MSSSSSTRRASRLLEASSRTELERCGNILLTYGFEATAQSLVREIARSDRPMPMGLRQHFDKVAATTSATISTLSPDEVAEQLDLQRAIESKLLLRAAAEEEGRGAQSQSQPLSLSQHQPRWFAIDAEWWARWTTFMAGGSEVPTAVDNSALVITTTATARSEKIREGVGYHRCNLATWLLIQKLYGGGPAVMIPMQRGEESSAASIGDRFGREAGASDGFVVVRAGGGAASASAGAADRRRGSTVVERISQRLRRKLLVTNSWASSWRRKSVASSSSSFAHSPLGTTPRIGGDGRGGRGQGNDAEERGRGTQRAPIFESDGGARLAEVKGLWLRAHANDFKRCSRGGQHPGSPPEVLAHCNVELQRVQSDCTALEQRWIAEWNSEGTRWSAAEGTIFSLVQENVALRRRGHAYLEAALQPVWRKSDAFYSDFAAGKPTFAAPAPDVGAVAAAVSAAHALDEQSSRLRIAAAPIETVWESQVDDPRVRGESYDEHVHSLENSFESFDSSDDDSGGDEDARPFSPASPAAQTPLAPASSSASAAAAAPAPALGPAALFVEPSPITRGTYPLTGATNSYCDGDGTTFHVRGANYLEDRVKIASKPALFTHEALSVFKSNTELRHIVQMSPTLSRRVADMQRAASDNPGSQPLNGAWNNMLLVIVWRVPGPPFYAVTHVFRRAVPIGVDPVADRMLDKLVSTCNGQDDDAWRKERFKFIPSFIELPYLVGMAFRSMGGARPALLATKIDHDFIIGPGAFVFMCIGPRTTLD